MTDIQEKAQISDGERRTLAALADCIIPASAEFGVPGAGDPLIVDGILEDAARRPQPLVAAIAALESTAQNMHDAAFADLSDDQRSATAETFREAHANHANLVSNLVVQAYYRDDRVMTSLGMELRAPHPQGYEVEQGDWNLLEPVRKRDAMFRDVRAK